MNEKSLKPQAFSTVLEILKLLNLKALFNKKKAFELFKFTTKPQKGKLICICFVAVYEHFE